MHVERLDGERVFVIHEFLSDQECETLVALAERSGFEEAPINSMGGAVVVREVRNNARVMRDDPALAASWFERARPHLPTTWSLAGLSWALDGLNERFRFYRYDPGERFAPHHDGCFERETGERSFLTFMVYLNEACVGGETRVYRRVSLSHLAPAISVRPETGKALVFAHDELHEGSAVATGRKYVVRSDVMYRLDRGGSR
jgi:hypothetical protein